MCEYPSDRRDSMFAVRFIRWLIESELTVEAGPDAFALLVAVVMAEDRIRYQRPPNFFNEQICRHSGIGSVPALIRARNRATELGLLVYAPAAKRRPGTYFVSAFPNDSLGNPEGIRRESVRNPSPSKPIPKPLPKPKPIYVDKSTVTDLGLAKWIDHWNQWHSMGLVAASVRPQASDALRKAWKRVSESKEVQELLRDPDAILGALKKSEFCRDGWFRLEKLLGGKNRDGVFIVEKLLDGGYQSAPATSKKSVNVGPGVKYAGGTSNAKF